MAKTFVPQNWLDEGKPPYFHWWSTIGDTGRVPGGDIVEVGGADLDDLYDVTPAFREYFGAGSAIPVPSKVANPDIAAHNILVPNDLPDRVEEPLPDDTVITVIIDEAIALGHPRFRYGDGSSRILSSWQQGASFDASQSAFLPFGNELYQKDIDQLLTTHSDRGDRQKSLDETAFNRAALLSEPLEAYDTQAITRRVAHGTAALDLAAGFDASKVDDAELKRRPIIAVNLPRRSAIGMAGTFLEYYTILALKRAIAIADTLWASTHAPGETGGYPIVVNISYGQQAGPKDGSSPLEQEIAAMQNARPANAPLSVVMPVGNDNLMQCNAVRRIGGANDDHPFTQIWRVQPEDHSSNFVEVWNEHPVTEDEDHPLAISLRPPGGEEMTPWHGKHGEFVDVDGNARIYCQRLARPSAAGAAPQYRFRYVIAIPPTSDIGLAHPLNRLARPGLWQIQVPEPATPGNVYMNVQVDQSAEPDGQKNRRGYFVQEAYQTHEDSGRPMDSYSYPFENTTDSDLEPWRTDNQIQRKGTVNSIAVSNGIVAIGSHRRTDGRPSDFSATAYAADISPSGNDNMAVSDASDDGAMHLGILAAGTQAASVVTPRGTSFSTPTVARRVVELYLNDGPGADIGTALDAMAAQNEANHATLWKAAAPQKTGAGRLGPIQPEGGGKVARY